ncbi:MAG: hypothetical protein JWM60_1705 [Solirubrobacterales bacterium]|nr:hypothetical protein [Solirubrobacterales bacterium]
MSRSIKIVVPDPTGARLDEIAETTGEPLATLAARLVKQGLTQPEIATAPKRTRRARTGRRGPPVWIEPEQDTADWRAATWGAIVALHHRYPQQLAGVQDGWWEQAAQRETLAALAAWRAELDQAGQDPRDELLFHAQLNDYADTLRNQGRGVAKAWQPGAPPDRWSIP